jgi:hypothetical protein
VLRVDLPGTAIKRILTGGLGRAELGVSGVSEDNQKIAGRTIRDNEWYRVAISSKLWTLPQMKKLLKKARVEKVDASQRFTKGPRLTVRFAPDKEGEMLTVRRVVMEVIEARRRRDPDLGPEVQKQVVRDLKRGGEKKSPLLYLDFKELAVGFEHYLEPAEGAQYSEVSEARVRTLENFKHSYRLDVSLIYDTQPIVWLVHGFLEFDQLKFKTSEEERADDLLAETEFRLSFLGGDLGSGISLLPSAKFTYDTEFTRAKDDLGEYLPRESLLRSSLGAVASGPGPLKMARLGFLLQYDLWREKLDCGLGAELDLRLPLGPFMWKNTLDGRWYFPADTDTPADLGLRVRGRSSLQVPFLRDLSLMVFVDVFLYRGKVDTTDQVGVSTILGFGFNYSRLWKPGREPLFH